VPERTIAKWLRKLKPKLPRFDSKNINLSVH
jgi:hypothetical protein